ncbi:MAG: phospholipase D-like domain-containing protein [Myxococcota bacterium]|nr:phospholipase D-like domain-containing protein [Myxococcota bacterium]
MMKRTNNYLRYATLMLALITASCDTYPNRPSAFEGSVWATHTAVDYFNRFHAFTVGNAGLYTLDEMERRTVELIVNAELSIDVALEYFESERIADALIAAAARGVNVKIVGDVDRRGQSGFRRIESAGLDVVYGDGEITWQAVFGRDLVYRRGEDNLMTHNFVIADRLRIINLTGGFPLDGGDALQAGFIAASEDLVKDYGDCFDQLHGGIFSTAQTFFDDSVSADTNNRTSYAVEDGVMEAYFGPQERLVKEVIDRIYLARESVRIATVDLRNREMARALRYKAESGFSVEIVLANESVIPLPGLDNIRINPNIDLTMISIDGQAPNPGTVMVLSMPLFEAVPYYFEDAGEETPLPQPSDRFTDANMWVVEQNVINPNDDYRNLASVADALYADGE